MFSVWSPSPGRLMSCKDLGVHPSRQNQEDKSVLPQDWTGCMATCWVLLWFWSYIGFLELQRYD